MEYVGVAVVVSCFRRQEFESELDAGKQYQYSGVLYPEYLGNHFHYY
jgi:hypothetical protein